MTFDYVKQCALADAHEEHDWWAYETIDTGSDFRPRHCWGKSISQRLAELAHEGKLKVGPAGPDRNRDKWHATGYNA